MTPRANPELIADADELTPDSAGARTSGGGDARDRRALEHRWQNRRLCWGTTLAAAASYGLLAGWWTPRGPLTTSAALGAMALSLAVGVVAGLVLRSRWAMLVAPVAFVVVFELMRLRIAGPTVDGVRLDSTYAVVALVVGRGVHGVLALLPMVLGAAMGAALARRRLVEPPQPGGVGTRLGSWLRRSVAVLTGLVLVAVAVVVARPGTTEPIVDADGRRVTGSVAELTSVEINGHQLAMMIRGRSTKNPVLLFLAGGPGGSELGAMRNHSGALEDAFVVATLDQRGTGKSYGQLDPTSTLTLDGAVDDVVEVTEYLRDRFGQDRVYLVGQSWGTILGVLAVQRRPQLYRAFVGAGQIVSAGDRPDVLPRHARVGTRQRQHRARRHPDPNRRTSVHESARLRTDAVA